MAFNPNFFEFKHGSTNIFLSGSTLAIAQVQCSRNEFPEPRPQAASLHLAVFHRHLHLGLRRWVRWGRWDFSRDTILMYLMMVNHMDNGDFMDLFHEKQWFHGYSSWETQNFLDNFGGFVWIFHGMNHRDMVEIIGKSAQSADGFLMWWSARKWQRMAICSNMFPCFQWLYLKISQANPSCFLWLFVARKTDVFFVGWYMQISQVIDMRINKGGWVVRERMVLNAIVTCNLTERFLWDSSW